MEKKSIPLIIGAIFSIVLLLSIDYHDYAFAQTISSSDFNFIGANNTVFAMDSNDLFVAISPSADLMQWIPSNIVADSDDLSQLTIQPYVGGCDAINNPCGTQDGSGIEAFGDIDPANEATWTGAPRGLWCGNTDCFTWYASSNSSFPHQLHRYTFDSGNFVMSGYMNWTFGEAPTSVIYGYDSATGGIGGITLFTVRSSANDIYWTGGTSLMQDVGTEAVLGGTAIRDMSACLPAIHDNCDDAIIAFTLDAATDRFHIYDSGSHTASCNTAAISFANSGSIFYNDDDGLFYVAGDTNDVWTVDQNCNETEIATSTHQDYIREIAVHPDSDTYYVYHASTATLPIVTQWNYTDKDATVDFDSINGASISGWVSGDNNPYQSMALSQSNSVILLSGDTTTARLIYLGDFEESTMTGATVCIDTNLDAVADLCFEDTNNDGVADNGQFGSLKAFQSNSNVTQLGTDWFCAFNIGNACTDTNVQTNGVGMFYLLIIIIFSYAFLVAIHIMAMKASPDGVNVTQALAIHPILLLVMLFVDVGFAWYLDFVEDSIFYTTLVVMAGLGGFGLYRMIRGNT